MELFARPRHTRAKYAELKQQIATLGLQSMRQRSQLGKVNADCECKMRKEKMGERKRRKEKRKGEKRNKPRRTGHFAVLLVRGLVCELFVGR